MINRNGAIFGAGAQVNVHTLIASSLDVGVLGSNLATRDQYFLNTGIANLNSFSIYDKEGGAATNLIAGDITVERGASVTANITSDVVKLGAPGSVYLFGANVHNSGSITAPAGELAMIAARTGLTPEPADAIGWNADSIEAEGWAYMAVRALKGLPISFPGTTGAPHPMTGGTIDRV